MPRKTPLPSGLLLLTGGEGRRLGAPKHTQPHPEGGLWGSQLVSVFERVFPGCPIQLLGEGLPDRPDLEVVSDPKRGPAVALTHWAGVSRPPVTRWWVVACDQVRWRPEQLAQWHVRALEADPTASHWVLARCQGRVQFLGGWLPTPLLPRLAALAKPSLAGLAQALPTVLLDSADSVWEDIDDPEALRVWLASRFPE